MGRHELHLQCSHDGAIPPWLLKHARDLDAAERQAGTVPASRILQAPHRRPLSRAEKVARMATLMVERAADGACTEGDLAAAGFTLADMAELGDDARAVALGVISAREDGAFCRRPARARRA